MGLFDRLKKGGGAAGGSSSRPTTGSVATRATTVRGYGRAARLVSSWQHQTAAAAARLWCVLLEQACACRCCMPAPCWLLQKDPMTQQEIEELVLNLNKIGVGVEPAG